MTAATLVDGRTETFQPLLPSDRGRFRLVHSGDVKIYEALDMRERAYLTTAVERVDSPQAAVEALLADPRRTVIEAPTDIPVGNGDGEAIITDYAPQRVIIRTQSEAPALLVLSDAYYPGWVATVDGLPAPVYPANVLYRGVTVPAGEHEVIFRYQPQSWQRGLWISAVGAAVWLLLLIMYLTRRRKGKP